ncbi:cytochrome c [Methylocapsa polymorpha]|uniref:Cytochrome c n=1 Tax=Methylocapsa polymorpha TaxID=3080828 RepID=A0ABZ0HTW3_9HYPH|nr:cytochrome c [Methylocapsa sp. RX1]
MRLALLYALAIGSSIAVMTPAFGQDSPGDVASGRRIAETWCAACHQIDSQGSGANRDAPSFPQVANLPSTTALALNVFLRSSHDNMPNFQLTRQEADDVIAYILSLKEQ